VCSQYLDKTNRAVLNGDAKAIRIKKILDVHAKGLFVFHPGEPYFIKTESPVIQQLK